ncbi:hypothetical protein JCM30471_35750 [Desulfuromonas carbonis]
MKLSSRLLLLFCLPLLAACLAGAPPPDPAAALRHAERGQGLIAAKDYRGAAAEFAQAQDLAPDEAGYALTHADLREGLGEVDAARAAYRQGLATIASDDPLRPTLTWRLALLELFHRNAPGAAARLGKGLAGDSFEAIDLDGALRLGRGDTAGAIQRFRQAEPLAADPAQAAFALYHASLGYWRQVDDRETFRTLLEAITQASARGLIRDIEAHFKVISPQQ